MGILEGNCLMSNRMPSPYVDLINIRYIFLLINWSHKFKLVLKNMPNIENTDVFCLAARLKSRFSIADIVKYIF